MLSLHCILLVKLFLHFKKKFFISFLKLRLKCSFKSRTIGRYNNIQKSHPWRNPFTVLGYGRLKQPSFTTSLNKIIQCLVAGPFLSKLKPKEFFFACQEARGKSLRQALKGDKKLTHEFMIRNSDLLLNLTEQTTSILWYGVCHFLK